MKRRNRAHSSVALHLRRALLAALALGFASRGQANAAGLLFYVAQGACGGKQKVSASALAAIATDASNPGRRSTESTASLGLI
jgi:hypothetical protein